MKFLCNCTVLFYNTPVFYKVSKLDDNEYYADPSDSKLTGFTFKKSYGEWYAEGESSHSLAIQLGKLIDRQASPAEGQ